MKKSLLAVALSLTSALPASALIRSFRVTKATQAQQELNYTLTAVREEKAVIVNLRIPREGKLKNVLAVRLQVLNPDGKHFDVWSPLEMRQEDGATAVSFQIAPELAERCSISVVTERNPPGRSAYERAWDIELKGYITERKAQ